MFKYIVKRILSSILVLLGGAVIICGAVLYSRTAERENKEN